ncbi:hypothetical protein GCM10023148_19380 [Actinokineospora soli]
MADVVAIHGMLMNRRSRAEMAERWHPAMITGLENVRCDGAQNITIEYAFYGHLYNDGKAGGGPAYHLSDLEVGLERDLFVAIGAAADDGDDATAPGKVWLPNVLQRAARRIEASGTLDGPVSRVIRLVKQVGRYFHDQEFANRVHAEVDEAMARKPKVVVAHSLGSVIAYNWLRTQAPGRVPTLVTIGSPLGFRGIRLALRSDQGEAPLPWPGVKRWVNVAATEDAIAMVKCLDGMFDGKIHDELASNTRRHAHSAVKYLENLNTADAIKKALADGQP